ncbi:MAG: hypothetical protein JNM63_11970 [Spirochaetia bacterium]|nr:hypothetical protein [Spirochaetia bacterium]
MSATEYIPGVCNIGPAEIRARRRSGWFALAFTVILWAIFVWQNVPAAYRLFLFFPAAGAATGYLQSAMHFCVGFGMMGVFNFGPKVGKKDSVEEAAFRKQDRRKAWQIILYASLFGAAVALTGYFLA